MKAKYKCCKCKIKFEAYPNPMNCPKCNHCYVKWTNYPKFEKLGEKE